MRRILTFWRTETGDVVENLGTMVAICLGLLVVMGGIYLALVQAAGNFERSIIGVQTGG